MKLTDRRLAAESRTRLADAMFTSLVVLIVVVIR